MPGRSLTEPVRVIQPAAMLGSPLRGTISTRRPLSNMTSCTGTFCARAAAVHRKSARRA